MAEPIPTVHLFAPLHAELVALLRRLTPSDWERPTLAGGWRVRDIAAHLLDGDLRRLSAQRDAHVSPSLEPPEREGDLVRHLDRLNADWLRAAERLSPRALTELLEWSGPQVSALFHSLPPHGVARWPVAWADETASENWMDIGREFTERWHHQAQIREAVGVGGLMESRWMHPVLSISMRCLRKAYARTEAPEGVVVAVEVTGEGGGEWSVLRSAGRWIVRESAAPDPAARLTIDVDTLWRLLYNALPPGPLRPKVHVVGDEDLVVPFFLARSVMV